MPSRSSDAAGFSLVELLAATTMLVVALSSLAQLLTMAAVATRRASSLTLAAIAAEDKLEALIPRAALDPMLAASPANTLTDNIEGYCDFVDWRGGIVSGGTTVPPEATCIRRWAVEPMLSAGGLAVALRVVVVDVRRTGVDARTLCVVRHVP
jgi:type II secretory pathway pseudopilin PulG